MQKLPLVKKEDDYPCTKLPQPSDNGYLFKVSCWKKRINVEFFHALTDGTGAQNFLQELVFHYIAILHPEIEQFAEGYLGNDTSLNREDSFFKNYKTPPHKDSVSLNNKPKSVQLTSEQMEEKKTLKKPYTEIYHCVGEEISYPRFSVIHGFFSLTKLKELAKKEEATINQYLTAIYIWCLYSDQLAQGYSTKEIVIAIPVNLRPWFHSITTKNFFVMAFATFLPTKEEHTFKDILLAVQQSLANEIAKERFESTLSFNVSNEKSILKALVPLRLKNIGIRFIYKHTAQNTTSTASNFGSLKIPEKFRPYITSFCGILPVSYKQPIRVVFSSYQDIFCVTFSSVLESTLIQQKFFSFMSIHNIAVTIETNGEYNGSM